MLTVWEQVEIQVDLNLNAGDSKLLPSLTVSSCAGGTKQRLWASCSCKVLMSTVSHRSQQAEEHGHREQVHGDQRSAQLSPQIVFWVSRYLLLEKATFPL